MSATAATRLRLAVLISGGGSNMAAIARACTSGQIAAEIAVVISDRRDVAGLLRAQELGLEVRTIAATDYRTVAGFDRISFESTLRQAIEASGAQLVVLAGFMRILSPAFAEAYAGRMLNIHPSLLPRFPGLDTHARALAAGDKEHGASVHYVTGELDAGPLVLQGRVPVRPGDTPESLSARVHALEHRIYPAVIGWIASGRLLWCDGSPRLDGAPVPASPELPPE
jgi:phosphoribosylglycinamide formyltransferase 1